MNFIEALKEFSNGKEITDGDVILTPGKKIADLNLTIAMQLEWYTTENFNRPRQLAFWECCEYEGCEETSLLLAWSRHKTKVMACCQEHARKVALEHHPEYVKECRNCGCLNPVN